MALEIDVYTKDVVRLSLFHLRIVIPPCFIQVISDLALDMCFPLGKSSAFANDYPKTLVQLGLDVPVPSK